MAEGAPLGSAGAPLVAEAGPADPDKAPLHEPPELCASGEGDAPEVAAQQERIPQDASECVNIWLLGVLYTVYLGFRSGCVVVLPLASKELLQGELDGAQYSPLYQVPFATWFAMDICIAAPSAYLLRRWGHRKGFLAGACASSAGSLLAFGVLRFCRQPWLAYVLLIVSVMVMSSIGMMEFARYAAADACSDPRRRSRSVSLVVSGGATLSMVGPFSASMASSASLSSTPLNGYADFFLVTFVFSALAVIAAASLRLPPLASAVGASDERPAAPLLQILRRPAVASAVLAQVAVQFSMLAPVSAVPLRMQSHLPRMRAADVRISGCIVLHEFCMFAPGLFSGDLIRRCGLLPIMFLGLLLQACCAVASLLGSDLWDYYLGMAMLGVGWNFAFVASTMLLLESHSATERTKVTSANETIRFTANGIAVLVSAAVPWEYMNFLCLGLLVLVAFALLSRRRFAASPGYGA